MKSRLMKLIAAILVLASLVSVFAVFVLADDAAAGDAVTDGTVDSETGTEDEGEADEEKTALDKVREEFPAFQLMYQRTFDDGWNALNGGSKGNGGDKCISIDYEQTLDYKYNYFWRFTVQSSVNDYIEYSFDDCTDVGAVIEFDLKTDDYTNMKGFIHYGTIGSPSSARNNYNLVDIVDSKVYLFSDYSGGKAPIADLTNDWLHIAIVFNLDYGNEYDLETGELITREPDQFTCAIYYGYTEEYERTGELTLYRTDIHMGKGTMGKGVNLMRLGSPTGTPESDYGTSVCVDNLVMYTGANRYGLADSSMGHGLKVDANAGKTETILGESDAGTKNAYDYIIDGVAMKVGVDHASIKGERVAIMTDAEGNAYGAPAVVDGNVMVPLYPILNAVGYPYYPHTDGIYVDISTGDSSSYISVGKKTATVNGKTIDLNAAPCYLTDEDGHEYLAVEMRDLSSLLIDWYVDYDDMGLITVSKHPDALDRDTSLSMMLDVMKSFIFDNPEGDEVYDDVYENTNGFDHPYILTNQDTFDKIYAAHNEGTDDAFLAESLVRLVGNGDYYFRRWAYPSDTREALTPVIAYDFTDAMAGLVNKFFDEEGNVIVKLKAYSDGAITTEDGGNVYTSADPETRLQYVNISVNSEGFDPTAHAVLPSGSSRYSTALYAVTFYNADGEIVKDENGIEQHYFYMNQETGKISLDADGELDIYDADGNIIETADPEWNYQTTAEYWNYFWRTYTDEELLEMYGEYGYNNSYSLAFPYTDAPTPGYDPEGGRGPAANRAARLVDLALAWVITHDVKYLLLGYEVAARLGEWDHWGPGHFLNAADTSAPYATFIDWTYDAFVAVYDGTGDLDGDGVADFDITPFEKLRGRHYYDINNLIEALYVHGVYEGYIACKNIPTEFVSSIVGTGGQFYHTRNNNWNAVCSSGMIIASLVVFDSEVEEQVEHAKFLASDNIYNLAKYGLDCYAPDGAYPEGTGYWDYGTNNFFELCMALSSSAGTTYGLMECWGIDTTCYYACHTESSDCRTFAYNDGGISSQDTSRFFYVGQYFGDAQLQQIRMNQLTNYFKSVYYLDIVAYPFDGIPEVEGGMELDYFAKTLDLYAARSSWDKGAVYVAAMGGPNKMTHGQIDGGSFQYHNLGTVWFTDLGTENYNCHGFWPEATRYRYYVMKPEGNNTLALASNATVVPWGQTLAGTGETTNYQSNEFGSLITYDLTSAFGGLAASWNRGVLLTNNRTTTIIQDEVMFGSGMQSVYWFGHFNNNDIDEVIISDDGRTAYMFNKVNGVETCLRVSIVAAKKSLKFEIWDAYTFVHRVDGNVDPVTGEESNNGIADNEKGTYYPEFALNNGYGVAEKDRSAYRKLVIRGELSMSFECAVVMEAIDPETARTPEEPAVGYNYVSMTEWEPVESFDGSVPGDDEEEDEGEKRGTPTLKTVPQHVAKAAYLISDKTAFGRSFEEFYRALTDAYYVISAFRDEDSLNNRYGDEVESFNEFKAQYDSYIRGVQSVAISANNINKKLAGVI
ncbi:MAG: hypothetical protein IJX38_05570 [Clostridia bacterium]|nr:hypothetical protein [Clostridia bacterium]